MKSKLLALTLCLCLLIGTVLPLASCQKSPAPQQGTYTRVTVDINPSVEFMVDDENKVVSVTALNDDGSILIAGEAFVGKTPEEAIAGAMGHYGQWENAAKYIDPRTDEETHSVASVFPVHE